MRTVHAKAPSRKEKPQSKTLALVRVRTIELPLYFLIMNVVELAQQIVANYQKHGWTLRRVLLRPTAEHERQQIAQTFPESALIDAEVDALWFARASHAGREAWELRLIAEQPYALFETFEADEAEEDREDLRREMENKMRDYAGG
jgi:hypothetical protein